MHALKLIDQNTLAQIPEHLRGLIKPDQNYQDDFGEITPRDIRVPFIKIVQGQSPTARPGWGPTGLEQPMQLGTIYLTSVFLNFAAPIHFVPLVRNKCYIRWEDRDPSKRMLGYTTDKNDPKITSIGGLEFTEDPNTGKSIPPVWDEYINFYCMIKEYVEMPVMMSFYRTSLEVARKLTQTLFNITKATQLPLFMNQFSLHIKVKPGEGNNSWYQWQVEPAGHTPAEFVPKIEELRELALFAAKAASAGTFGDADALEQDAPLKSANPVATTQPTPVVTNLPQTPQPALTVPRAAAIPAAPVVIHTPATLPTTIPTPPVAQPAAPVIQGPTTLPPPPAAMPGTTRLF